MNCYVLQILLRLLSLIIIAQQLIDITIHTILYRPIIEIPPCKVHKISTTRTETDSFDHYERYPVQAPWIPHTNINHSRQLTHNLFTSNDTQNNESYEYIFFKMISTHRQSFWHEFTENKKIPSFQNPCLISPLPSSLQIPINVTLTIRVSPYLVLFSRFVRLWSIYTRWMSIVWFNESIFTLHFNFD